MGLNLGNMYKRTKGTMQRITNAGMNEEFGQFARKKGRKRSGSCQLLVLSSSFIALNEGEQGQETKRVSSSFNSVAPP